MKNKNGFTLVEMLITVAIIGILATIALPTYKQYHERAIISEGLAYMNKVEIIMSEYIDNNRSVAGFCDYAKYLNLSPKFNDYAKRSNGNCSISGNVLRINGLSDNGWGFSIDSDGNKSTFSAPSGFLTNSNCWVTNTSGDCQ